MKKYILLCLTIIFLLIISFSSVISTQYILKDGEEQKVTIGGTEYTIKNEGVSGTNLAVISVNGVTKSVTQGITYKISGLDVYVSAIYYYSKEASVSSIALDISQSTTPVDKTCTDSDGGLDYYTKGSVTVCTFTDTGGGCGGASDSCSGDVLTEGYCENNDSKTIKYTCPYGCSNGACLSTGTTTTIPTTCTDSDSGKNYYIKGTVKNQFGSFVDGCSSNGLACPGSNCIENGQWNGKNLKFVDEMYCEEGSYKVGSISYECPYGCVDGACVKVENKYDFTEYIPKYVEPNEYIRYTISGSNLAKMKATLIEKNYAICDVTCPSTTWCLCSNVFPSFDVGDYQVSLTVCYTNGICTTTTGGYPLKVYPYSPIEVKAYTSDGGTTVVPNKNVDITLEVHNTDTYSINHVWVNIPYDEFDSSTLKVVCPDGWTGNWICESTSENYDLKPGGIIKITYKDLIPKSYHNQDSLNFMIKHRDGGVHAYSALFTVLNPTTTTIPTICNNLVTNGDFETGNLNGWYSNHPNIKIVNKKEYSQYVYDGSYSVDVTDGTFQQQGIPLTNCGSYPLSLGFAVYLKENTIPTVHFIVYPSSQSGTTGYSISYYIYNANTNQCPVGTAICIPEYQSEKWYYIKRDVQSDLAKLGYKLGPYSSAYISLGFVGSNSLGNTVYYDDVVLNVGSTPATTTTTIQGGCVNHNECSQACDYLGTDKWQYSRKWQGTCPYGVYGCMTGDCCLGQCTDKGGCYCDHTNVVDIYGNVCPSGTTCGDDCRCHLIKEGIKIDITSPKDGQSVSGIVRITAEASSTNELDGMTLSIQKEGEKIAEVIQLNDCTQGVGCPEGGGKCVYSKNCRYDWDTSGYDGSAFLTATITDNTENKATDSIKVKVINYQSCNEKCKSIDYRYGSCKNSCDSGEINIGVYGCTQTCPVCSVGQQCAPCQSTTCCCVGKKTCPYDCCVNDPDYSDKSCPVTSCPLCKTGEECPPCIQPKCINHQCSWHQQEEFLLKFKAGWNMFSFPVDIRSYLTATGQTTTAQMTVENVITGKVTEVETITPERQCPSPDNVWHYSNGKYIDVLKDPNSIVNGWGYWVNMGSDCMVRLTGNKITINDFPDLEAGWNQVGGPSEAVNFYSIIGDCNLLSGPWWFNSASKKYEKAQVLRPGEGYFVKVKDRCKLGTEIPPLPPGELSIISKALKIES